MNGRRIRADFGIVARTYRRTPIALFFSLIFPILLILLFGYIFYGGGPSSVTIYVQNFDHGSPTSQEFLAALNHTGVATVAVVSPSIGNLSVWLGQHDKVAGLVIPAGFQGDYRNRTPVHVLLYTNPTAASEAGLAQGAVQSVVSAFNLGAYCRSNCTVITTDSYPVGGTVLSSIDYLVPGLVGFSILTGPMFSMVDVASSYRKDGLFRLLSLTPLSRGEWLTSRILWFLGLTFVSLALMLAFGVGLFGAHVMVSPLLVPFLVVGPFLFVSLGMLLGSLSREPETAAVVGNAVTFPMMFLAGTFFPVSAFPAGLQIVARIFPLYYIIDGMNQVMLFGNVSRALVDLGVSAAIGIVFFVAAIRVLQWRGE